MANSRSERLVYGFIRTIATGSNLAIPKEIVQLSFSFYLVTECFELVGSNIEVEINGTLISKRQGYDMTNEYQTAYGHLCIDPSNKMKHKWTFIIHQIEYIVIGIDEFDASSTEISFIKNVDSNNCGVSCDGGLWSNGGMIQNDTHSIDIVFEEGSNAKSVTMIFSNGTLEYYVNGGSKQVAFTNIAKGLKYKMAVAMYGDKYWGSSSIQLSEYLEEPLM